MNDLFCIFFLNGHRGQGEINLDLKKFGGLEWQTPSCSVAGGQFTVEARKSVKYDILEQQMFYHSTLMSVFICAVHPWGR